MQEKKLQSNETDITGALVVTFFVMLGILFVTLTGNLTKKSTSTSTKAALANKCDSATNKQLWYNKSIECGVLKDKNKCPESNPVVDNTFLYSVAGLRCRTFASMDSFFSGDPTFKVVAQSYQVRRGDSYCVTQTGKNGAKCLSGLDYDSTNNTFINTDYNNLTKTRTKCPNFWQSGIMTPYAYTLSEDVCYTP